MAVASPIGRAGTSRAERLDEPEAGLLIEGEGVRRDDLAIPARQPDFFRLGDEIADRQHQAVVANDDAAALADGSKRRGGEGVLGNAGA